MSKYTTDDLRKQFAETERLARNAQTKMTNQNSFMITIATTLASVVMPLIEGFLVTFADEASPAVWIVVIGIHAAAALYSTLATRFIGTLASLIDLNQLADANALINEGLQLQNNNLSRAVAQSTAVLFSLEVLRNFISGEGVNNLEQDVEKLLSSLLEQRIKALDFESEDVKYDMALYIYDPKSLFLEKKWRNHNHEFVTDRNRKWTSGKGYIGQTFASEDGYWIEPDSNAINTPDTFNSDKDQDIAKYRSFMAVAFSGRGAKDPIGVFIISSQRAGQFTKRHYHYLALAVRHILSIYFDKYPPT